MKKASKPKPIPMTAAVKPVKAKPATAIETSRLTANFHLWIGLPIEALTGEAADETKAQVRQFLLGPHTWRADGQPYACRIGEVTVASQPVGALFDYLRADDGSLPPDKLVMFKKEIGIVGIGMNTVDLLVVQAGRPAGRFIAGSNLGIRRLLDLASTTGLYTPVEADDLLRQRQLDLSVALPVWSREVTGFIEQTWGRAHQRFAQIIVVGGGAALLKDDLLKKFRGKLWLPDDPLLSTAHGLYKMALSRTSAASTLPGTLLPLALDAGFGNTKVWGAAGPVVLQSAVSTNGNRALGTLAGLRARHVLHIEDGAGSFWVGAGAHGAGRPLVNMDLNRFNGSPELSALVHGALTAYLNRPQATT